MVSNEFLSFLQWVILLLSTVNFVLSHYWIFQNKKKWRYSLPILLFSFHSIIFYTVLKLEVSNLFVRPYYEFFTDWSVILRLQVVLSVTLILTLLIDWGELWKTLRKIF